MKLLHDTPVHILRGQHQLTYIMTEGTAKLQMNVDGLGWQDIPRSEKFETTGVIVTSCSMPIKAILTGDAELSVSTVTTHW